MGHVKLPATYIQPDRESIGLLCRNVQLLLRHAEHIVEDPDWYGIHIDGLEAGGCFVGTIQLRLGDLLMLWLCETPWVHIRQDGDTVFVYGVMGSIISDYNFVYGWSERQQDFVSFRPGVSFRHFYFPAVQLVRDKKADPGRTPLTGSGILAKKPPQRHRSDKTVADLIIALDAREGRLLN